MARGVDHGDRSPNSLSPWVVASVTPSSAVDLPLGTIPKQRAFERTSSI